MGRMKRFKQQHPEAYKAAYAIGRQRAKDDIGIRLQVSSPNIKKIDRINIVERILKRVGGLIQRVIHRIIGRWKKYWSKLTTNDIDINLTEDVDWDWLKEKIDNK